MTELECHRCGRLFDLHSEHTEIVRRDFIETPQPSKIEYLCGSCLETYTEEFMGGSASADA
ncbi:MAG: hypothetical protein SVG88_06930 [Halobacteriales archaeon]|nr:hypothetical protein [Halobacteriales archaeon]